MNSTVFRLAIISLLCFANYLSNAQSSRDSILYESDRSAQFPGGIGGLYDFIKQSIHYPPSALAEKHKQKVGVQMTISENGAIRSIITPPNLRKDFDDEIHRLIASMPKWLPASKNNQLVESTVFFFVNFIPPK
ncbi:hypothetical protein G8759_13635 [Spirosoma aureum]|uniref:TonB C-terminal domain-containing protein n=1 Tax=Spirosoma aureum TaxID=2692134 RepID=A0A6G9AMF5_9BACT|nr:hypothetical protein [Spirosoma aureum]QIP13590.1 hypothetical protein G8759_13635 [Spirosoma aureum]